MTIGKAVAVEHSGGHVASRCVVPCYSDVIDVPGIRRHLAENQFFWLDLTAPSHDDLRALRELFDFHPLAIEDTEEFGQRPKLDDYGDYVLLVFYGAADDEGREVDAEEIVQEVHLFISGSWVVTIHRRPLPSLEQQRAQLDGRTLHSEQFLLYRLLDSLTDSFFPVLSSLDDEIDSIEAKIVSDPDERCLERLFMLKRRLVAMRKVVSPQRDLFARSIDQIAELPGLTLDERDYFRDVYDHLIRISDLIDSYRDLLSGATDLYVSIQGNRQNEVMKQLTIIATIFLPLSFITGFFGQNFGFMINHLITAQWTFWVVGVGSMVVTCLGLLAWFRHRSWL